MWNSLSDTHKNVVIIFSILGLGISLGFTLREWGNVSNILNQHLTAESIQDSMFDSRLDQIELKINIQNDSINRMLSKIQLSICEMVAQDIVTIRQCRK